MTERALIAVRLACIVTFFYFLPFLSADSFEPPLPIVRVGWYEYPGFYLSTDDGYRSGYAYDYLQEITRYTGWKYEYVNATAQECLNMLQDGSIDLLATIIYSPERENTMSFSQMSLGKDYSVLVTLAQNMKYRIGNYSSFDEIRVGGLSGDIRESHLRKHAETNGYSYRFVGYKTVEKLQEALKTGEIEAMLTTNMRLAESGEKVIAHFAPREFYIAVKKGNEKILDPVNNAMEQIEFYRKGFQSELAKKYFSVDMSGTFSLTDEEKEFIANNPIIDVLLPGPRKPLLYYHENNKYEGISIDIMNQLAQQMGVRFEFYSETAYMAGESDLVKGRPKFRACVFTDYGYAEKSNMKLSLPYMNLGYVLVAGSSDEINLPNTRVAAVGSYQFSKEYVGRRFLPEQITYYESEQECIEAVYAGKQNVCFINSYTANDFHPSYKFRNLFFSPISYSHGISVGIPSEESTVLLSIIDKAILSLGENNINQVIENNNIHRQRPVSLSDLVYYYPVQLISIFSLFGIILSVLLIVLIVTRYRRKQNEELFLARIAAENDALTGLYNRITYEVLVTQKLHEYGEHLQGIFVMLDIDDFKQINDQLGHRYGDDVLIVLAQKLRQLFTDTTVLLCRMGGDEFSFFLTDVIENEQSRQLLHNVQQKLASKTDIHDGIGCSIGFAAVTKNCCDFSSLYEAADLALYCAKHRGKGRVCSIDDAMAEPSILRRKTDYKHTQE